MAVAEAAARTQKIRLTSAVTVLSAGDPVRAFQEFATLDLISNGRTEIVCRGSSIEALPLFGFDWMTTIRFSRKSSIRFRSGSESAELRLHLYALVHSDVP